MAKIKNWAYPLDGIGKSTPPVKAKNKIVNAVHDGISWADAAEPASAPVQAIGGQGPTTVTINPGTWTGPKISINPGINAFYSGTYSNPFNEPPEPVEPEWAPAPPPIKTTPPKPVPGRLYPVINTGARVEKKVSRKFFVYVDGLNMWSKEQDNIVKLLTEAEGFDAIEDKIELQGAQTTEWYYVVKELND